MLHVTFSSIFINYKKICDERDKYISVKYSLIKKSKKKIIKQMVYLLGIKFYFTFK